MNTFAQKSEQACFDSLRHELAKSKEDTNRAIILLWLCAKIVAKDPDLGMKYAVEGYQLSTKLGWKKGIAKASNSIGWCYTNKRIYDKAIENYKRAIDIFTELGNTTDITKPLSNIASAYNIISNYTKSTEYYLQLLKIDEANGSSAKLVLTYNNLGGAYMMDGNYPQAQEYFFKALKLLEELGDSGESKALVIGNFGNLSFYESKFPKALEYYIKSLNGYEAKKDTPYIADATANICETFSHLPENDTALNYCFKSMKRMNDFHRHHEVVLITRDISELYAKKKNYPAAIFYAQKALQNAFAINDSSEIEYNLKGLGNAYYLYASDTSFSPNILIDTFISQSGEKLTSGIIPESRSASLELAIDNLEQAKKLSSYHKKIDIILDCYDLLTKAYKLRGEYGNALKNFEIYVAMKDSLFSKENEKKLVQQQMQYDFDKKDAVAKEELLKQKREKQLLLGGSILMLIIAGGSVYILIYTRKAKKLIEEQKNRAEQSERFKQQFLANMSHEIRTPMNAVLGMTNLIIDNPQSPKVNKYLSAVKKSSESLLVIINDILDLSKLQAGKMELEHIPFMLREQVGQVYNTMQFKAEEKGLILETIIARDIPDVLVGDPSRLNQILINLCANAIKFTEKGNVRILVEYANGLTPALSKVMALT